MASNRAYDGLEIAIIGMSGQFPESNDCSEFWQNLRNGEEMLKTFSNEELRTIGVSEEYLKSELFVKTVGVLNNKNVFDCLFFGYSTEEAALMDPQMRLFHEHAWKALEDAGYSSLTEKYKIGIFAGASTNNYWKMYTYGRSKDSSLDPYYLNIISSQNFINTLISYKLNLRGPSCYVDTACSTSLMAVHLACRSLITRESSIALAGGVSVNTMKKKGYFYQEDMIASRDGHCRTFDAQASGCAIGEGLGIVVLKRLSEAIRDRDHIYAVIKSTSANNDGNHKVGYTAPSVKGQSECIIAAHKLAGIDPHSISYVEAHGTATKLGDPVEIRALNEAFGVGGSDKFCAIGSVKSSIGHLDTAAGVAGLIKTALSLQHKQIPASLHFKQPNPEIDFDGGPFYVNTKLQEWKRKEGLPLRAGVSSLGIGGTNVHVILEEAPEVNQEPSSREYKLMIVSAKTENSAIRYLDKCKQFLIDEPSLNLDDMSYTLCVGRKHFPYRKSIVYHDREDLLASLQQGKSRDLISRSTEQNPAPVFMFPGQGTQYAGMSRGIYETEPVFRELMDHGFNVIENLTGERYKEILFSDIDQENINQTRYTQPMLFLVEYSLAQLMMSIGIVPKYMIGHSIGEYVAACIGGVFNFEDALRLVIKRGALMNSLPPGDMLSILLTEEEAKSYLNDGISMAAVNSPEQVVLSGDTASIDRLKKNLHRSGLAYVKLRTSHAFHSHSQDPIMDAFKKELQKVTFNKLRSPFISNLTGVFITEEEATSPDYWVRQMRETVRFADGLKTLLNRNQELVFVEAGAGNSLTNLLKQQRTDKATGLTNNLIRSFKEQEEDVKYLTKRIGELWAQGVSIDWSGYYKTERRNRISIPTYSFEPVQYPTEVDPLENILGAVSRSPGNASARDLKNWIYYPSWKRSVSYPFNSKEKNRIYLLFSFDKELFHSLKNELSDGGDKCIEVLPGEAFQKSSATRYVLCPEQPDHFLRLFDDLESDGVLITDIVYSWGIGVDASKMELEEKNKEINMVYFSLVELIQVFLKKNRLEGISVSILTGSLHRVAGSENIRYAQSLMLGFMNVLIQEYAVKCCNIDIDLAENDKMPAKQVAEEINSSKDEGVHIVAIRNGHRWVPDFQKNQQPALIEKSVIRQEGAYLITGGLGNVGFILAKYLIQNYDARIILTGRRNMEKRTAGIEREEECKNKLDYLNTISKNVRYFSSDVANIEDLRRIVEDGESDLGNICGVIHTAGIGNNDYFELIEDITSKKALAMFAPKVKGVMNIYGIFKERRPDFVWVTSSLSSVLGGLGFSSYSAANLFMDHFITSIAGELDHWKCIQLAEMAFSDEEIDRKKEALTPRELTALFEWSLSSKGSPVITETIPDLSERMSRAYIVKRPIPLNIDAAKPEIIKLERPGLSTIYSAPETETEERLMTVFENFFGIANIGAEDNFFELGGDSLKGMMLLKRIKQEFNINLSLKDFLMNTTIRLMAEKIDEIAWLKSDIIMENEIKI
jgi:acyl transferase domain-containing protein/acyl carrier protein